jgi:hypothetical protein
MMMTTMMKKRKKGGVRFTKKAHRKMEKSMPSYAAVFLPLCATYFLQVDNKITPNRGGKALPLSRPPLLHLSPNTFDKYLKRIPVCREILNSYLLKYFINGCSRQQNYIVATSSHVPLPLRQPLLTFHSK